MNIQSSSMKLPGQTSHKKQAYPTKRTINLYYRVDKTTRPATLVLYGIFVAVLLLACVKLFFFDLCQAVDTEQSRVNKLESELVDFQSQLKDYKEVKQEYARYGITEDEQMLQNRMEVLSLVESAAGTEGRVESVSVAESMVSLQIANITLAKVSTIVQSLENSDLVQSTTVNTAASKSSPKGEKVDATLVITLMPTEVAASQATTQRGN